MTDQQSLPNVWASDNSGVEFVNAAKYSSGWVAEIPTYQNFNYVLQTTTKNILAFAEKNTYTWEGAINYSTGAKAQDADGHTYYAFQPSYNVDPSEDLTGPKTSWKRAPNYGDVADVNDRDTGLHLKNVDTNVTAAWSQQSQTVTAFRPSVALVTTTATDNHVIMNDAGFLSTLNTGTTSVPDGRSANGNAEGLYRIYHEGYPPEAGVGEVPQDNIVYGRQYKATDSEAYWVPTSGTIVANACPNPVRGAGQGWFNLADGTHYTDIFDGDSSQWVPSSPPQVPTADSIPFDNTGTTLSATTMQEAIVELSLQN
jgi:hypothetical protein